MNYDILLDAEYITFLNSYKILTTPFVMTNGVVRIFVFSG